MQHSLLSKNALVTGASRGIGKATALALGAAGAHVLVHCNRGVDEARAVAAEIRDRGGRADVLVADLASVDGARILAAEVGERARRLDVLVACAGIAQTARLEDTRVEDFDRMFAVNVRAPFFLVQQLLPLMGEGSSVVMVSSLGARSAVGEIPAYAATKGALDTLVLHFAQALGGRGIRVNGLAPGGGGHRDVQLRAQRRGAGLRARHPGPEARRTARGHCRCRAVPGLRCVALDHRRHPQRRRWHQALTASHLRG